jgi:2-iminobutanoate/2-iminopropanoate deaminase
MPAVAWHWPPEAAPRGGNVPRKEIIHVDLAAANPNLSPAIRFGNLVFVAGQTGRHPMTGQVGQDIREQTRNALERIRLILAAAGASLDNVLQVTTHLTRREDLTAYNEEYARYFPSAKPARTTVEVMLNSPELLVEITVIAGIPG